MELLSLNSMFCMFTASALVFFFFPIIKLFLISVHRRVPLPPSSLGWPYIGETFLLYSQNPNVFFASKIKRFRSIFKSQDPHLGMSLRDDFESGSYEIRAPDESPSVPACSPSLYVSNPQKQSRGH